MNKWFPDNLPLSIKLYCVIRIALARLTNLSELTPSSGRVLDVGCGYGLCSWIIAKNKPDLTVDGVDIDPEKIKNAQKYFCLPNVNYQINDIIEFETDSKYDAIVASDTFYLIPYELQEKFIARLPNLLNADGKFILKEMNTRPRWKYYINVLQETIAVKLIGFTWGSKFFFRPVEEYEKLFKTYGLHCQTIEINGYCHPQIYYIVSQIENFNRNQSYVR